MLPNNVSSLKKDIPLRGDISLSDNPLLDILPNVLDHFSHNEGDEKNADESEQPFIIALDSEYQLAEDGKRNIILSYQYVAATRDNQHSPIKGIIYTRRRKNGEEKRQRLKNFLRKVILDALQKNVITQFPKTVYVVAHFLRADLSSFLDFFQEKTIVQGIRKTLASITDTYGVDVDELLGKSHHKELVNLSDNNNNMKQISIRFIDTQLLTPAQQGLATLGEIVGLEKLSIPEPYSIERMEEYLKEDKQGFEAYALRDAEIVFLYAMKLLDFTESEFNRAYLPVTLASIGVSQFLDELKIQGIKSSSFLGMSEESKLTFNNNTGKYKRMKIKSLSGGALTLERFAIECYHGGRNEAFCCGYTPIETWYDYDLPSAYTTALINIHPLNYDGYFQTTNVNDFKGHTLGLARVEFRFPEDTRYPCLPVKTENGLIYPLSGISYCTAPEIEVALGLGCEIVILEGFVIPWETTDKTPFSSFVKFIRKKREMCRSKESPNNMIAEISEKLWKEIGNSLYGKLAQGLKGKKTFDVAKGLNKLVPRSKITNAFYASYVTGFVRAVVSQLLSAIPPDKVAVSVTTDGFITNAHLSEFDLSSLSVVQRFSSLVKELTSDENRPVLELKHQVKQLCCMKNRGQFTVEADGEYPLILAKASVQVPDSLRQFGQSSAERRQVENSYIAELYFNREANQKVSRSTMISTRESFISQRDLIKIRSDIKLNLEFDMKRHFSVANSLIINNDERLFIQTKPWKDVQSFYHYRAIFDEWKIHHTLKKICDFHHWIEFSSAKVSAKGKRVNVSKTFGADKVLLRQFLRCFAKGVHGGRVDMTYKRLSKFLTEKGYTVSEVDIKNAARASAKIQEKSVARTPNTEKLLSVLLEIAPNFEAQRFFVT